MHVSLVACTHALEAEPIRAELVALALDVWATPGIVYALPLLDAGKCGLLTMWAETSAFEVWTQRSSYLGLQRMLFRLRPERLHVFDCPLDEADVQGASSPNALREAAGWGQVISLADVRRGSAPSSRTD